MVACWMAAGIGVIFLPLHPEWRVAAVYYLQESPALFYQMGAALLSLGLFFAWAFFMLEKGRFLSLSMKAAFVSIDSHLVREAVEELMERRFPSAFANFDVAISPKNRIEVGVDLVSKDYEAVEKMLAELEPALGCCLRERFGYTGSFGLDVRTK